MQVETKIDLFLTDYQPSAGYLKQEKYFVLKNFVEIIIYGCKSY